MALFTEREGRRKAREQRDQIEQEDYELLVNECERFFTNLAWRFPRFCDDDDTAICGMDKTAFFDRVKMEIPGFALSYKPYLDYGDEKYDYLLVLDFIEFVAVNVRDYKKLRWHEYFKHTDYGFLRTNEVFKEFKENINEIFDKTGLQFVLTDDKQVERKITTGAAATIATAVAQVQEPGLKDLLNEALANFRSPRPEHKQAAVEKLWDAFERMKTYYLVPGIDKAASATKIVTDIAAGSQEFYTLFNTEFVALTAIGNNYRIRHHETNKIEITKGADYDYLFNRCISLIERVIKTLVNTQGGHQ